MSGVQRYVSTRLLPSADGWNISGAAHTYVAASDYDKLRERVAELEAQLSAIKAQKPVVMPERFDMQPFQTVDKGSTNYKAGWNCCLYEVARLNGGKVNEQ